MAQPVTAKSPPVSVPLAEQEYNAVPEEAYPASAAVVHVSLAASVPAPAVHAVPAVPPVIFHPPLAELKAAGMVQVGAVAHEAPVYPFVHVHVVEAPAKAAAASAPLVASQAVQTPSAALVPSDW